MKKNNFYDYLKKIKVPQYENKAHYEDLKDKLLIKIQKSETEKRLKSEKNPLFKISFSLATLTVIALLIISIYFSMPNTLNISKSTINGSLYLKTNDQNDFIQIKKIDKLKENYLIKTGDNSKFTYTLGKNYNITLNENTELMIEKAFKYNRNEICKIYLHKGNASFSVDFPTKKSQFQVDTDISSCTVKGTKFSVNVKENQDVEFIVNEGKVWANYNYKEIKNINKIKKINKALYEKINCLINEKIIVNENSSLIIKQIEFDSLINDINENILKPVNTLKQSPQNENKIIENINNVKNKKSMYLRINKLFMEKSNEAETDLYASYHLSNLNMVFDEKDNAITNDEKNIFIASDANNTVLCIEADGRIKYSFKDKDLLILTSGVSSYLNEHIFASPDFIYVLSSDGKIKIKHPLTYGAEYWANAIKMNNNLYIPVSKSIFQYDGKNISMLENLHEANGQLYISGSGNILYMNDLNNKNVKAYDLIEKKIIWESAKLNQRAFMSPLIVKNNLYIADMSGTIYKFDLNSSSVQTIAINAGIMSKMVYNNNYIYFTANDGYFYRIESNLFKNYNKIARLDNDKNSDKFLTKKTVCFDNEIFYCAENGFLFSYDCNKNSYDFIKVKNSDNLIASPVFLNNAIYVFDVKGNCYKIVKNK